jgi:hypothetical protein
MQSYKINQLQLPQLFGGKRLVVTSQVDITKRVRTVVIALEGLESKFLSS